MLRVNGCVFCSISLWSVYMCVRMPLSLVPLRECVRARRFRASLLLCTTCAIVRSCCNWRASCVAIKQPQKKKSNHRAAPADQGSFLWSLWYSQGNDSDRFRRRCQCTFQETWKGNGEGIHEGSGQSWWNRNRTWNVTMKNICCYVFMTLTPPPVFPHVDIDNHSTFSYKKCPWCWRSTFRYTNKYALYVSTWHVREYLYYKWMIYT